MKDVSLVQRCWSRSAVDGQRALDAERTACIERFGLWHSWKTTKDRGVGPIVDGRIGHNLRNPLAISASDVDASACKDFTGARLGGLVVKKSIALDNVAGAIRDSSTGICDCRPILCVGGRACLVYPRKGPSFRVWVRPF